VAFHDLVGHAWPYLLTDHRAAEGGARATSLWRSRRGAGTRPLPPSRRMSRAHMPRRAFLALAFGWVSVLAILLCVVLAVRWFT
jgi:hypothetical protein